MESTETGCGSSEPYVLRVLGDSMEPEFEDGCIVVVDPAGSAEHGAFVIASHNGEYIFRQLEIEHGRYRLKPLNPGYPTLEMPGAVSIVGVIVQKAGTRRNRHRHYL